MNPETVAVSFDNRFLVLQPFFIVFFSSRMIDIMNLDVKSAKPYVEKFTKTHEVTH